MKDVTIQASLYKRIFEIGGTLEVEVNIRENELEIPLDLLTGMAARKNKKRCFLFVSKVIGKHIPIFSRILSRGGYMLAHLFINKIENKSLPPHIFKGLTPDEVSPEAGHILLKEPTLFIGFAETATGLGHAVYSTFRGNTGFLHTTRDNIKELSPLFLFDEEHSHAPLHRCYTLEKDFMKYFSRIVLIDDEITTGRTALNLIRSIHEIFPKKHYIVMSLLDWRSPEDIERYSALEGELNIEIDTVSLISGNIRYEGTFSEDTDYNIPKKNSISVNINTIKFPLENNYIFTLIDTYGRERKYLYNGINGRFGIYGEDNQKISRLISQIASNLTEFRNSEKTLCLGCNEYIYIPAMIASEMDKNIYFQSATRSPIHSINKEGYAVKSAISFSNPFDDGIMNFVYNILPGQYEEIFFFLERDIDEEKKKAISEKFSSSGIKFLNFVVFC